MLIRAAASRGYKRAVILWSATVLDRAGRDCYKYSYENMHTCAVRREDDTMLTEKENLIRMHRGEMPEFLPRGGFREIKCSRFEDVKKPGYHIDEFGVEYMGKEDIFGGAPIPYPGRYILHDIRKWRDIVKAPDLTGTDWEALARRDLAEVDRESYGVVFFFGKIFQRLCDFMGFTEGLCAIAEEPGEVQAMFEYLCDFSVEVMENVVRYYRPDAICIPDDTATARGPFISPAMYRELVKPYHARIAQAAQNGGAFVEMHDCGHCEAFIEDWMDFGVCSWNPAQPSNDLLGIKKKYGRRLIISGGWDTQGSISFPETDDALLKDALAEYVDTLAPGGGFSFAAAVSGKMDDPRVKRKWEIINSFYKDYARDWYARRG